MYGKFRLSGVTPETPMKKEADFNEQERKRKNNAAGFKGIAAGKEKDRIHRKEMRYIRFGIYEAEGFGIFSEGDSAG